MYQCCTGSLFFRKLPSCYFYYITKRQRLATLHQRNLVGIALRFHNLADAAHELRNPLAAATVLIEHAQDLAHLRRILIFRKHCLLVEVILHALTDAVQMVVPLHSIGDGLTELVVMRRAACHFLVGSRDVWRGDRQPVRDISRVVVRAFRHAREQVIIAVRLLKQCTLDTLDAVRIDLSFGIRIGINVVLARDTIEYARNEVAVRRRREVASFVLLISCQVFERDFFRILLCLLACLQTRAACR